MSGHTTGPVEFGFHAANNEHAYWAVTAAVTHAVLNDAGHGTLDPVDAYRDAHRTGEWETYLDVAGLAVAAVARRWVLQAQQRATVATPQSEQDLFLWRVFEDVLDLSNRAEWARVAENFMPDPDDIANGDGEDW